MCDIGTIPSIHARLPLSMDGYVQAVGRVGRDGRKSRCVLFYTKSDFDRNKRILSQSGGRKAVARRLQRLNALHNLVISSTPGNVCGVSSRSISVRNRRKSAKKCCRCRQKSD